jgi:glycogen phosphorylase
VFAIAEAERTAAPASGKAMAVPEIATKLKYTVGKPAEPTLKDLYQATAWSVREKLIDAFEKTHDHWE